MLPSPICHLLSSIFYLLSSTLRLRHVLPHLIGVGAAHGANELSFASVNLDPRKCVHIILLRYCRAPVDDIDLAHRDLGVALRQLLERRVHHLARSTPIRIEVHNRYVTKREMFAD